MFEYLYPLPFRSPRLSLAEIYVSKRHSRFRRITLEDGFPSAPEAPSTVFAVIRNCFQRPLLVLVFIRLNREYYLQIQMDCYCKWFL